MQSLLDSISSAVMSKRRLLLLCGVQLLLQPLEFAVVFHLKAPSVSVRFLQLALQALRLLQVCVLQSKQHKKQLYTMSHRTQGVKIPPPSPPLPITT